MNERRAVAWLRRGDIGGLEYLVRAYQERAVRAATLITRDRALAEDLVQEAFIRAFERIDQFDPARPFGPWFLRSVVNDAVKAVSRARLTLPLDASAAEEPLLPDPALGPEALLERADTHQTLWEALGRLPPEQRAAIVLRYYLDFTEAEIAGAQRAPLGTVKWRLHAARQRLRDLLTPWRAAVDAAPDPSRAPHVHGEQS